MAADPKKIETLRPHFSWTQLQMMIRCGMQYYFRYIEGRKERPSLNLTRGSAGHLALEVNARHKIATKIDQPSEEIIDNFVTAYDKDLQNFDKSDFEPGDDPGKDKDQTIEGLRLYRIDPRFAAAETPLAVELDFTVPLPVDERFPDELKPITGKIDIINKQKRIVTPNGRPVERTVLLDNKFPARKPSNVQALADINDQLTMYDFVLTQAGQPTQDIGFRHFIPPTKTIGPRIEPTFRSREAMTSTRRMARHERLLYKIRQAMRAIQAGIFMPTDDPKTCSWCGFRDICQNSLVKNDYDALLLRGRR